MDLSKAFDMVEWVGLFKELMNRKVSAIFLRVLIQMYSNQKCKVGWNGSFSRSFQVTNGVRQGMPSSGFFFNCIADFLITRLRKRDVGLKLFGKYVGVWIYADDIIVLSASRQGLQSMVTECDAFAKENGMKFSTNVDPKKSKTKCIIFSKKPDARVNVDQIILNNDILLWVSEIKHVGNILENDNSFRTDCLKKRGNFIGKVHSLQQEFPSIATHIKIRLIEIYTLSFYGSALWDIFGPEVSKLYRSYNTAIRIAHQVDRTTRTFLVEPLSDSYHPHTLLCSRLMKFHKTNIECNKPTIKMLACIFQDDQRTRYGQNLRKIANICGNKIENLTSMEVKNKVKYKTIPKEEEWRLPVLWEMMEARNNNLNIEGLSKEDINAMIHYVCTC